MTSQLAFNLPHYASPQQISYRAYINAIVQYNASLQKRLKVFMEAELHVYGDNRYAALTTGSDGRLEKGPESLVELIVLHKNNAFEDDLQQRLNQATQTCIGKGIFSNEYLEVKDLSSNGPLSYYKGDPTKVFPSRLIDSVFLYGCEALHDEAMQRLGQEFIGPAGKRILERTQDKRREYGIVMRTGIQKFRGNPVKQFDLEEGVSYYNPEQGFTGFKHGPLRYIQFSLIEAVLHHVRNTKDGTILVDMPTSTQDRIFYAKAEGITQLTESEMEEVIDTYAYFLWLVHKQQEQYKERRETTLLFNQTEIIERTSALGAILSQKRIIKRGN